MVVVACILSTVQWSGTFFMVRIAVFIPILAQSFVTAVFHSPHGVMGTFVDVKHFTSIFSFPYIQHLARSDGSSAVRIIFVTYGFHFQHMLTADGFISRFIEKDARIVTIVYDSIAHQFFSLLPLPADTVLFSVTCRHSLNQPYTVARFNVLFPRGDVHPANQIGITCCH